AAAARAGNLVCLGITPERAETGYGYIRRGEPLAGCEDAFAVKAFVEKPDSAQAQRYIASGKYLWNGSIFLFPVGLYLAELERLRPAMLAPCKRALAEAKSDADFVRLDKAAFAECPADAIDYAVIEHPRRAAVVPVGMGWTHHG